MRMIKAIERIEGELNDENQSMKKRIQEISISKRVKKSKN